MHPPTGRSASAAAPSSWWLPLLVLVTLLCYGVGIAQPGRFKVDELFYMRSAAEMLWSGNYLYPVFEGVVRLQKPPATYWMVAASYHVFGIHLWSARLPSVLLSALGIVLTWRLALFFFESRRAALYASAVLLSSYAFYRHGRWAMTDTLLCVSLLAAYSGFAVALWRGKRAGATCGWTCVTLAVLTKGPVGIAVPALSLALFALVRRREPLAWRLLFDLPGIAIFLAGVGSWGALMLHALGDARVEHGAGGELARHVGFFPLRFFPAFAEDLLNLLRGLVPWALLLFLYRRREERDAPVVYLLAWVIANMVVFALFVNRQDIRYLVIAMPPAALLAGNALLRLEERGAARGRLLTLVWIVLGLGFAFFVLAAFGSMMPLARMMRRPDLTWIAAIIAASAAAFLGWLIHWWRRGRLREATLGGAFGIAVLFGLFYGVWSGAAWTSPAFTLGASLRPGLPAHGQLATAGLDYIQRSWLSLGAARPVRNRDFGSDYARTFAAMRNAPPPVLVVTQAAFAVMPARLRARYVETQRLFGGGLRLRLGMGVDLLRGEAFDPYRNHEVLIVLRRRSVEGADAMRISPGVATGPAIDSRVSRAGPGSDERLQHQPYGRTSEEGPVVGRVAEKRGLQLALARCSGNAHVLQSGRAQSALQPRSLASAGPGRGRRVHRHAFIDALDPAQGIGHAGEVGNARELESIAVLAPPEEVLSGDVRGAQRERAYQQQECGHAQHSIS